MYDTPSQTTLLSLLSCSIPCATCCGYFINVDCLYSTVPKPKPGYCPRLSPLSIGICVELCTNDDDCKGDSKCCSNGCGHTCQKPGIATNSFQCSFCKTEIMGTLASQEEIDVLAQRPEVLQKVLVYHPSSPPPTPKKRLCMRNISCDIVY